MFSNYQNRYDPSVNNKSSTPSESVKFLNVKPKYFINDDILLDYILDSTFQPTHRDYVGIYPRGWNDLVQYATFEWIITRPNEASSRRNILFRSRYHSQVVQTDREYQFVYINSKIEVMGRSQFFRFLPTDPIVRKSVQKVASGATLTPSISVQADAYAKPSAAERIHNLEDRNHSLEERIQELEKELELSLVSQKQLKLEGHHAKRERLAYQKFVNELLHALSQKGIARVIDGQGTEVVMKRIPDTGSHTDNVENRPPQVIGKTSRRERFLKAIIGTQEQKIRDLMVHLDATTKACCNLSLKMDLVNISKDEEEVTPCNAQPAKHVPQSLIAVLPKGQGDTVIETPQLERNLEDLANKQVDDSKVDCSSTSTTPYSTTTVTERTEKDLEVDYGESVLGIKDSEEKASKDISERPLSPNKNSASMKYPEKPAPAAVVLQCDTTKFAVIRY